VKNTDNITVIPEGEHSPLGPSSSKRWINCPGSVNASEGKTEDESQYAAEGTAAHYLSELCRKQSLPAATWMGHIFQVGKYKFTVDQEMVDSVQAFVDWCAEQDGKPLTETRIDYSEYMPESTVKRYGKTFGTLDDARMRSDVCYITDFKHGKGIQEWAEGNTQLMLQALGVYAAFNWIYEFKGFVLQISQPRLSHFDSWPISVEDLLTWAKQLPDFAAAVEAGTCFKAGAWCRFCRIRKSCAVRANAGVQAMLDAGEFEDLDQLEVHALRARNAGHMITTESLVKILPALDIFKAWIKDMERRAISELIAGDKTLREHFKLVEGRSNRRWKGDEEKIAQAIRNHGVEPYTQKLMSVAEAEKAFGKKHFPEIFGKDAMPVDKPPGKPKLVPVDDKRPEITGQALVEFDNLDESDE
jgi:Protein of unknown function (DUF2800)